MRSADPEILQILLAHGADPHLADIAGFSAMHNRLAFRDYERIRMLLAAGAGPKKLNTLAGVVRKGPIAMVHQSTLMLAAPHSDPETVAALLTGGARVNETVGPHVNPSLMNAFSTPVSGSGCKPSFSAHLLHNENAKPITTYERAEKIAGLRAAGVPVSNLRVEAAALFQLQRPDGGWAQMPHLDSDAYATGMVLNTLYTAGLASPDDPSYRKGVYFLLRTQFPDGSWYVRSRVPKFQPYFQSGFPFDQDQWISCVATSLAVMGLAPASTSVSREEAKTRP
ncbi:MAG: hypothetical protein ACR2IV_03565 [Bryobacteraceae bacterium]